MLRARGASAALLRLAGAGFQRSGGTPLARANFSRGFLDRFKSGSKDLEAIKKEKARLKEEMTRGYFKDIAEIRNNAGKIAEASKVIIPEADAVKFPDLAVHSPSGGSFHLPLVAPSLKENDCEAADTVVPDVSLVCLSFRASSQKMAESWSIPFLDSFDAANVHVYEVSFLDSWLLSSSFVRRQLLKMMRKSDDPRRDIVYAFGDHYDFRKQLQIPNLLTGYIYLVGRLGRIRWQGFGYATPEELSSLTACTSTLLDEK